MKKKIVALLLCVTMAAAVTGCDKKNEEKTPEGTEAVLDTESGTGVSSASIEYDAKDYVELGEYKGLAVTIDQDYSVDENTLRDYVNNTLIAYNPYYVEVDKETVENGDVANIDYEGTKDGEAFSGGTATGHDLEIGSGSFIDGFEDGIIGMKVGEEKDLNLTFPEDYSNSDLAGAEVVFHVKVNKIQEKKDVTYDTFSDEYTTYYAQKNNMTYTSAETLLGRYHELSGGNGEQSEDERDSIPGSSGSFGELQRGQLSGWNAGCSHQRVKGNLFDRIRFHVWNTGRDRKECVQPFAGGI